MSAKAARFVFFHYSRCSKSRAVAQLLSQHAQHIAKLGGVETIEYMKQKPSRALLSDVAAALGPTAATDMVRSSDSAVTQSVQAALDALEEDVSLLQRPIVMDRDECAAVVGRPPARVLSLFGIDEE
eukprot:TRINITY_DN66356_c2_g1_i1.p2 TRINITY_DN66356_c2_g1~~TRINITY_DN66356_c2_g1_i1.p2  ORF type:complete len:127 (+),score=50.04 TRINITY_DN66356_c2_g1_i1:2-382(+)